MTRLFEYFTDNKDGIQLITTIIVGISTIITSCVNIYLVKCQVDIDKEQTASQNIQSQPIFDITIRQQQDSDDGKYGTDILEVRNIGTKVKSCDVVSTVFFCLSKHCHTQKDVVYAEVKDYFYVSVNKNVGDGLIKQQWCPGNNRFFSEGYNEAIRDSHDGIYYFFDKIIILKIDYKDILEENHTLYYQNDMQISQEQYNNYFESASASWGVRFFTLRNEIYNEMKKKVT